MRPLIPHIFHFVFGLKKQTEPFHLAYYLCIESCLQTNHPDQIFFYYKFEPYGRYWELIKDKVTLVRVNLESFISQYSYKDKFVHKFNYAHHSDFIRLRQLVKQGGVYADIDTIFVNKIPDYFYSKPFVLGKENDVLCQTTRQTKRSLCNAFIMSQKESEFGIKWLQEMKKSFDGSWSKHSTFLPQELSEKYPEFIHIESSKTFYKHMWTREGIYTLLEGYDANTEGVVSMHLWSHLWWSRKRCDFSNFHAGKLNEKYIRTVDTTYNLIARKFLPKQKEKPKKWTLSSMMKTLFKKNDFFRLKKPISCIKNESKVLLPNNTH